jgi:uncharacterized hydrophobic protein (TIGR00271 family)
MALDLSIFQMSPQRQEAVLQGIAVGSEPGIRFYALVATSTLIASLGLIANSTAVIIGAMLVAPLMSPIFGIALALVRGDASLLGRAIRAEVMGMMAAVGIAWIFGSLPLAVEVTPEMLSRTQPNLLDLLVAVLAGFAGCYAMIDEHLSPALPGVAIATAIVPPLANSGICLAVGAYQGAWGSFLLFLANFISILIIASATFIAAGLAQDVPWGDKLALGKRFGVPAVGFLLVAVIMTHSLVKIVQERNLTNNIKQIINKELSKMPTTGLVSMVHQYSQGELYVLATVRTPRVINPNRVKAIQETISKKVDAPTALVVRSVLAKDVGATGTTSQVTAENLNGAFMTRELAPDVFKTQFAEQALREILYDRPELELLEVDLLHFPAGPVILASIQGPRVLIPTEIQELEKAIQHRLNDLTIHLMVRCLTTVDVDDRGRILYGWSHLGLPTPEQKKIRDQIEKAVRDEFRGLDNIFATNVDAAPKDDKWQVRVEVVGSRVISPNEAARLEKRISRLVDKPVKIYFWSKAQAMVTPGGYSSVEEFTRKRLEKREEVTGDGVSD